MGVSADRGTARLLACVLAMVMVACAVIAVIPGENVQGAEESTPMTSTEFLALANEDDKIVLDKNVTVDGKIEIGSDVDIDLNGFTITTSALIITAEVNITDGSESGTGKIVKNSGNATTSVMEVGDKGVLTMTGGSIDTTGNLWYGVYAQSGSNVTLDGTTINSTLSCVSGNGLENGAVVKLTNVDFTSEMVAAVFFPSTQSLTVTGGSFTGATGFDIRAGTVVTITGAEITIDLTNPDWTGTSGPSAFGMGVAVFDHKSYGPDIDVTVSGCTINNAVYDYYVGGLNLAAGNAAMDADKAGVGPAGFDASKVAEKYTFNDTIKMSIPGFTFNSTAGQAGYQFAAVDATASSFTVPAGWVVSGTASFDKDSSATVELLAGNGGLTFSKGSVEISGIMTAAEVAAKISSAGEVVLKNLTITDGTLTITDEVAVEGNVIVNKGATIDATGGSLNIAKNAVLSVSGTVKGTVNNEGTVSVTDKDASIPEAIGGSGTVDTSAVASEGDFGGSYDTNTTYTKNQILNATRDVILVSGTQIIIEGVLNIPEGITLTIEPGAQLIVRNSTGAINNEGTIIIQSDIAYTAGSGEPGEAPYEAYRGGLVVDTSATIVNDGVISLEYETTSDTDTNENPQLNIVAGTVTNNGQIVVGEESVLANAGTLANAADAVIDMNGILNGDIMNAGSVVFNGTNDGRTTNTIFLTAAGATVQIDYLVGNLAIQDVGLENTNIVVGDGDATDADNENREANLLRLVSGTDSYVSGLIVTCEIVSEKSDDGKTTYYYNDMVLSGSVSTAVIENIDVATDFEASATLTTDGPRVIVSGELAIGEGVAYMLYDTLTVAGTVTIEDGNKLTGAGTVKVTEGTLTAYNTAIGVSYEAASYTIKADAASKTPATYVYTTLANALDSGATPITVKGELTIDQELTIADGITVNAEDPVEITEDGYLTVADGGRFNAGANTVTVNGSLYVENAKTGTRGTTGLIVSDVVSKGESDILYTNLYNALNAAESGDEVVLAKDATTTRDITVKTGVTLKTGNYKLTIGNDTVATVDGIIYTNGGSLAVEDSKETNEEYGYIVLNGTIQSDMPMDYGGAYPAGAYYSITTTGKVMYYIQPVEDAAAIIATVDESTVTVKGDVTIGDVAFAGTSDEQALIIVEDDLVAGTVTIDNAVVRIVAGATFNGTVTDSVGTVAMNAAGSDTAEVSSGLVEETKTFTVAGSFGNTVAQDTKYSFALSGAVSLDGATIPGANVAGTAKVVERTVISGDLTVTGTIDVVAGKSLTVNGTAYIAGTVNALVDEDNLKATVTLGTVYVGLEVTKDGIVTGTPGELSGSVSYTTAYVSADSTVPEDFVGSKAATAFYVEDALWMTVYGTSISAPDADVTDADFQGWDDPETDKVEDVGTPITLSQYERLDAIIDYNVYYVKVYTDGGIGSVAIDGVILTNYGGNYFTNIDGVGLKAGEHKLTYTLKSGFTGEATMTIDGQAVSGDTFTLGGEYGTANALVINLAGTEPVASGEIVVNTGSDDMSLTDILLIILVVLIVIMAVIVALRLMRS